jgi:hypothetical protein
MSGPSPKESAMVRRSYQLSSAAPSSPKEDALTRRGWQL